MKLYSVILSFLFLCIITSGHAFTLNNENSKKIDYEIFPAKASWKYCDVTQATLEKGSILKGGADKEFPDFDPNAKHAKSNQELVCVRTTGFTSMMTLPGKIVKNVKGCTITVKSAGILKGVKQEYSKDCEAK
jgi:hypothetical protein